MDDSNKSEPDAYYGDDDTNTEDLDLSFLDEKKDETKSA